MFFLWLFHMHENSLIRLTFSSLRKKVILTSQEPLKLVGSIILNSSLRRKLGLFEIRTDLCTNVELLKICRLIFKNKLEKKAILKISDSKTLEACKPFLNKVHLIDLDYNLFRQLPSVKNITGSLNNNFKSNVLVSAHVSSIAKIKKIVSGLLRSNVRLKIKAVFLLNSKSKKELYSSTEKIISLQKAAFHAEKPKFHSLFSTGSRLSRITSLLFGMHTYAKPSNWRISGCGTAEGQLDFSSMMEIAEDVSGMLINDSTRVCFLIGKSLFMSFSPTIHNSLFKLYGANAVYFRLQTDPEQIESTLIACKQSIVGYSNITAPYKEIAMNAADRIDSHAAKIGAANTLVNRNKKLYVYNTDWTGFLFPLKDAIKKGMLEKAVVIGAGGAARAVIYALLHEKVDVSLFNRTEKKALFLAKYFGCDVARASDFARADIIVNCTPPLHENDSFNKKLSTHLAYLPKKPIFYDLSYFNETHFMRRGKASGCLVIPGSKMLFKQAVDSFFIYHQNKQCNLSYEELNFLFEKIRQKCQHLL